MRSLLFAALSLMSPAGAADAEAPHPHQGVLERYANPPVPVSLTAAEEAQIRTDKPVFKQIDNGTSGRGAAVFVVDAPPERVWQTIRSFEKYPDWIDAVEACEVYDVRGDHVYARFVLKKFGMEITYFIDHTWAAEDGWVTWTLDYSRTSDFDDSVGMWRVSALPEDPQRSKVEYSVDLYVTAYVPGFVRSFVVEQGIKDATKWVKARSE